MPIQPCSERDGRRRVSGGSRVGLGCSMRVELRVEFSAGVGLRVFFGQM